MFARIEKKRYVCYSECNKTPTCHPIELLKKKTKANKLRKSHIIPGNDNKLTSVPRVLKLIEHNEKRGVVIEITGAYSNEKLASPLTAFP